MADGLTWADIQNINQWRRDVRNGLLEASGCCDAPIRQGACRKCGKSREKWEQQAMQTEFERRLEET